MLTFPNAKINIGLNITEKRPDGYHNLETIFYPIELCGALEFIKGEEIKFNYSGLEIEGNSDNNLIMKAYRLLKDDFDLPAINIHLHKSIPMGAGLGGGSADAAFMLKMLNKELADLRARYQSERDNTIVERIRQDIESLETFIQQFTASQSRTFDFQMHLMITANTKEELENKK